MLATWIRKSSHRFLSLLALCLAAQQAPAGSPSYHQSVSVGQDGEPSLQLTNDSDVPITAFLIVHFPSLGMEGRDYYDVYIGSRDQVIPPGGSIARSLSFFKGSESNVHAEVRAVIFKDGSSSGDPVWVNAILARRLRFYDRLLSVNDLLSPLVGTGASREEVLRILRAAEAGVDKQFPQDDLRMMEDLVFHGAISTFETNLEAPADAVLKGYLKYWEKRALTLEYSRPNLDTIRNLPATIPKPLSDASLPADFQAARATSSKKAGVGAQTSSVPYCSVLGAEFEYPAAPQNECIDEEDGTAEGDTDNEYTSFKNPDFTYYNAAGKPTEVPWSWSPIQTIWIPLMASASVTTIAMATTKFFIRKDPRRDMARRLPPQLPPSNRGEMPNHFTGSSTITQSPPFRTAMRVTQTLTIMKTQCRRTRLRPALHFILATSVLSPRSLNRI